MPLKEKDFIEIEFTGKIKDGEVFDSNIKKDLMKLNPNAKTEPFVFSIGQSMFLKGIDDFLIGKNIGKHVIELTPDKAFGKRDPKLIQMMPVKVFHEQKINPVPGYAFNFDGRIGKVLTSSGGRVIVDFNNPLAGKEIVYNINILRKIEDINEKIKSINEFLFRQDLKFEIKDKKLILEVEKSMVRVVEMFKDKYKEILELDLEAKGIDKKEEGTKEKEKTSKSQKF